MGWAWLAASLWVAALALRRGKGPTPGWAVWAPGALFVLLALLQSPMTERSLFTLEGFSLPRNEERTVPWLYLGGAGMTRDTDAPLLPVPGLPDTGPPAALRAEGDWAAKSGTLRLELSDGFSGLLGFRGENDPPAWSNLYELTGGERITICPDGDSTGCEERLLRVTADEGSIQVGPCDLGGEIRKAGEDERAVALLDLYHYAEDRCTPEQIDDETRFWMRRGPNGSLIRPLRSFLLVQDGAVYLARLDSEEMLEVEGLGEESAVLSAPLTEPARLSVLSHSVDDEVLDALALEALEPAERYCSDGYDGEADAKDLSGKQLCKRVRIFIRERSLEFRPGGDRLFVVPAGRQVIGLEPECDEPWSCELEDLRAAVLVNTPMDVDNGVPVLNFPRPLRNGEPVMTSLRFAEGGDCDERAGDPCVIAETWDGERAFPTGAVLALGSPLGEEHLVRVNLLNKPWWILFLVLGLGLFWAALMPVVESPLAAVVAATAFVLLAARALFGFKVMAMFPHDPEGLATALLGLATLPPLLAGAGLEEHEDASGSTAPVVAALIAGVSVTALFMMRGVIPSMGRELVLSVIGVVFLALAILAALRWFRLPELRWGWVTLAVLGFGTLLALRLGLSVLGRERALGLPVIVWFWPAAIAVTAVLTEALLGDRSVLGEPGQRVSRWVGGTVSRMRAAAWPWRFFIALGLIIALLAVQSVAAGDKGAAVVLGLPLLAALLLVYLPLGSPGFRTGLAALGVVAVLGGLGGRVLLGERVDRAYPDVADRGESWEIPENGKGLMCPAEPDIDASEIDLDRFIPILERDNVGTRIADYLHTGAANRAGTRVGAEVHEFFAVLQRYAAGPSAEPLGSGYMTSEIRRYGTAEVDAQLSDGVPSILVASEGGTTAVFGLLLLFLAVAWVGAFETGELLDRGASSRVRVGAFVCAAGLVLPVWAAFLMLGGNFGLLFLTGQSTPLLAVLSGSDLLLTPVLWAAALISFGGAARVASEEG